MIPDPVPCEALNIGRDSVCQQLPVRRRSMHENALHNEVPKGVPAELRDLIQQLFYQAGRLLVGKVPDQVLNHATPVTVTG